MMSQSSSTYVPVCNSLYPSPATIILHLQPNEAVLRHSNTVTERWLICTVMYCVAGSAVSRQGKNLPQQYICVGL